MILSLFSSVHYHLHLPLLVFRLMETILNTDGSFHSERAGETRAHLKRTVDSDTLPMFQPAWSTLSNGCNYVPQMPLFIVLLPHSLS